MSEDSSKVEDEKVEDKKLETKEDSKNENEDLLKEVEKWKALSKKNEQRAKDNLEKLAGFELIQKENQSLKDRIAELKTQEENLIRRKAITEFGLPEKLIDRLIGTTKEEIEQDAKELSEVLRYLKGDKKLKPTNLQGEGGDSGVAEVKAKTKEEFLKKAKIN